MAMPQTAPCPARRATCVARRSAVVAVLAAALGAAAWLPATAGANEAPEYRLKAAFVYNFTVFTEWPASVGQSLNLCLFGPDPFGAEIDALHGKRAGDRQIAVHRRASVESLRTCQVVYLSASTIGQLPRILEMLRGQPVLTIADAPGALQAGAVINMIEDRGRIAFEANLQAARAAQLTLRSNLLRLASEVIR